MLRSISHHFSNRDTENRNHHDYDASTDESVPSTNRRKSTPKHFFGSHPSIEKAFSHIFNRFDSAIRQSDDKEMYEFVRCTASEENLSRIHRPASNVFDNTPSISQPCCTTTVQNQFCQWRNRLKIRRRPIDHHHERNESFLIVDNPDTEAIFLRKDSLDHQQTKHAQPCVQINDTDFDLNQIQYSSATSMLSPLIGETALVPYLPPFAICSNLQMDFQSTRSSVECDAPQDDSVTTQNGSMSKMVSVASPSSTNSSSHEYTGIDRSVLNDTEYVRAQELDLSRLIDVEIDLCKERFDLEQDLEEEVEFNKLYDLTLQENLQLKEDLKALKEENDPRHSSWSCELCTFINKPFTETKSNVCEICEGPSPLKRATLIQ